MNRDSIIGTHPQVQSAQERERKRKELFNAFSLAYAEDEDEDTEYIPLLKSHTIKDHSACKHLKDFFNKLARLVDNIFGNDNHRPHHRHDHYEATRDEITHPCKAVESLQLLLGMEKRVKKKKRTKGQYSTLSSEMPALNLQGT